MTKNNTILTITSAMSQSFVAGHVYLISIPSGNGGIPYVFDGSKLIHYPNYSNIIENIMIADGYSEHERMVLRRFVSSINSLEYNLYNLFDMCDKNDIKGCYELKKKNMIVFINNVSPFYIEKSKCNKKIINECYLTDKAKKYLVNLKSIMDL